MHLEDIIDPIGLLLFVHTFVDNNSKFELKIRISLFRKKTTISNFRAAIPKCSQMDLIRELFMTLGHSSCS